MLLRDLSGFLNGVECISEYKLSPFLLYGFLFQEKRIQAYLVFLTYEFKQLCGLEAQAHYPTVFAHYERADWTGLLKKEEIMFVGISQSGTSISTIDS